MGGRKFMHRGQISCRHFGKRTEGVSAVEFALILPVFVLIVFGSIDFGNLFYQWNVVNEAAREAARIYATATSAPSAASVQTTLRTAYDPNNQYNLTVQPFQTQTIGNYTQVTAWVTETVTILTPVISELIPNNPTTVNGYCIMQVENQ
jgi:Flp pilus assembly protein TadG